MTDAMLLLGCWILDPAAGRHRPTAGSLEKAAQEFCDFFDLRPIELAGGVPYRHCQYGAGRPTRQGVRGFDPRDYTLTGAGPPDAGGPRRKSV